MSKSDKKNCREHNNKSIEESPKYFNTKVKPVNFEEDGLVLLKEHNFMHVKRKLAEKFKGPFKITKVQSNGTALIRTKTSKHDHLVNTNLLVKYNVPPSFVHHQINQDQAREEISKIKYQKRIFETRPDGGPVRQSKMVINNGGYFTTENITNETSLNQIDSNFAHNSLEKSNAINLIKSWDLIDPIDRFEVRMTFQKPENLIKKRL
jgi:hypothetical protein